MPINKKAPLIRFTFSKSEKLCSRTIIKKLLASRQKSLNYPFLLKWLYVDLTSNQPVQVLISVPKKRIPKAVHRNYIKRIIRESYRKNKHLIFNPLTENNQQIALSITFLGHKKPTYEETEQKITELLQQLATQASCKS